MGKRYFAKTINKSLLLSWLFKLKGCLIGLAFRVLLFFVVLVASPAISAPTSPAPPAPQYWGFTLEEWKNLWTIAGVIIALLTLGKAVIEYIRVNKEKRANQFLGLRGTFRNNAEFQIISELLVKATNPDHAACALAKRDLRQLNEIKKFEFMAFFEDVAFLVKSGLISEESAYYMFGWDVISAWRSDDFWCDRWRVSRWWKILAVFVADLEKIDAAQNNLKKEREELKKINPMGKFIGHGGLTQIKHDIRNYHHLKKIKL